MLSAKSSNPRILVAIPAYNEQETIQMVVHSLQKSLSGFDLIVINDGSNDETEKILQGLEILSVTHLCNLGYGRAIQTAIQFAWRNDYDTLITLDADGQHEPEQILEMLEEFEDKKWDLLIGSRYIKSKRYNGSPFGRRIGMQLFSVLTKIVTGKRIYDTSSGLKIVRRNVFEPLLRWHFVDFHAEALVYLMRLGYQVGEYSITVNERIHGQSMYSTLSYLKYPLKTSLLIFLAIIEAGLETRKKRDPR